MAGLHRHKQRSMQQIRGQRVPTSECFEKNKKTMAHGGAQANRDLEILKSVCGGGGGGWTLNLQACSFSTKFAGVARGGGGAGWRCQVGTGHHQTDQRVKLRTASHVHIEVHAPVVVQHEVAQGVGTLDGKAVRIKLRKEPVVVAPDKLPGRLVRPHDGGPGRMQGLAAFVATGPARRHGGQVAGLPCPVDNLRDRKEIM